MRGFWFWCFQITLVFNNKEILVSQSRLSPVLLSTGLCGGSALDPTCHAGLLWSGLGISCRRIGSIPELTQIILLVDPVNTDSLKSF